MTTRKSRVAVAALVLAAAAALFALIALTAVGGPPDEGPPAPTALPGAEGAPPLTLAEPQEERAVALMKGDPGFRSAVAGVRYDVATIGPWTTEKEPELLGASVVVALERPTVIRDGKLPSAIYDGTERTSPPYQDVTNRVTARGVSELMVLVDLRRGKVVSVTPGPGSTIVSSSPPPGFQRTVPDVPQGG